MPEELAKIDLILAGRTSILSFNPVGPDLDCLSYRPQVRRHDC